MVRCIQRFVKQLLYVTHTILLSSFFYRVVCVGISLQLTLDWGSASSGIKYPVPRRGTAESFEEQIAFEGVVLS